MGFRIGTDIGGTFTDLVVSRDGQLLGRHKSPTTPEDLSVGVLECVALAAAEIGVSTRALLSETEVFVHGSTVATNAVLEGKVAKCGVICTRGTRYTLWRGEGRRRNIFDFTIPPRAPLVRPHLCFELDERMDRDGNVLRALDEQQVLDAVRYLRAQGCTSVAVCLLWSVRNAAHEIKVAEIVRAHWPEATLSLSSEVQPVLREYTRMSCTALNAMLKPVVSGYLRELDARLRGHGLTGNLLIVTSDGGVQPVEEVSERPVYMLFSGPATGPNAAKLFAAREQSQDCLLIDMGGTSFDVSTVIDGEIATTRDGRINDHPTGVSAVQVLTLGAGGGSIAMVDEGGLLRVGPHSAGARPGPACYGRGGQLATVTDAYVVLGYLVTERFLGGRMHLDGDAARRAIEVNVARPLGIGVEDAALGICRVVNEKMVNGILEMTVRRGIDPRRLMLVTGGGATGVAALELARELGISRIIVPRETSVLCAYGALNADLSWSTVASHPTSLLSIDRAAVNRTLNGLVAQGTAFLDHLAIPQAERRMELHASARYPMQVTEIEVPCPSTTLAEGDAQMIARAFHAQHRSRYSVCEPESDVEFVMWRVVARGPTRPVAHPPSAHPGGSAIFGSSRVFDTASREFREMPMINPALLRVGEALEGPALIVAPDTTVVLPADARASVGAEGQLIIELGNQWSRS